MEAVDIAYFVPKPTVYNTVTNVVVAECCWQGIKRLIL